MSSTTDAVAAFRNRYQRGPNQFIDWSQDKLGVELSAAQQRLLRAVAEHRRVLVIGANGPGKSYAAACLSLAFLHSRRPSTVLATSGTYGKLKRTLCRPVQSLQRDGTVDGDAALPGTYKHSPPRVDTGDPEWFFEAARPKDAGELEGTHNDHLLAITEEADKDAVDADVVASLDSCLTDTNDRHLVIANPPEDEANIVHDLMQDDTWHVVRFATWDSRNVRADLGQHDGPKIPGLLGLSEVRDKWEAWNGEPWPGIEQARAWSDPDSPDFREDLSQRWYRRRAGVMPPGEASVHRPIALDAVRAAHDATPTVPETPDAVGIDVARSGDETVLVGLHDCEFQIHDTWQNTDYPTQERDIADYLREWPDCPVAIDAVGEGSGLADGLAERFPDVTRFKSGSEAAEGTTYRHKWAEALAHFGEIVDGGSLTDRALFEQASLAARIIQYDETYLASRGDDGAQVLTATSKDELATELGRSPDHLDAALMAAWAREADPETDDRISNPVFGL